MRMHKNVGLQGFTLIEILVALTIFAIISTITASTMYYAFQAKARVSQKADQFMRLELALTMMEKDFLQITPRSVIRDNVQVPEIVGESEYVEFTRGGLPNPLSQTNRSTLARVAYVCKQGALIRRSWPMLDQPNKMQYRDKILLENLKNCRFAYLNANLELLEDWRAALQPGARMPIDIQKTSNMPKAIRFTLNVPGMGSGQFLFMVPGVNKDES